VAHLPGDLLLFFAEKKVKHVLSFNSMSTTFNAGVAFKATAGKEAQRNGVYDGLGSRSSKPERYGADDSRRKRALLA
jgi:hypothetical protein